MKDQKLFKRFMAGLGEVFDKEISDILSDIYWEALVNYSDEQCKEAFNKAMVQFKFFPKPAEIIELISKDQASVEDQALIVANQIIGHLKSKGHSSFPDINHDPIAKYLMTTRWNYYDWSRNVLTSELKWWVKEFCEFYQAYGNSDVGLKMIENDNLKQIVGGIGTDVNRTI